MNNDLSTIALPQLDELIGKYKEMRLRSKHDDCSDLPDVELNEFALSVIAAIHRIAGENNDFSRQADNFLAKQPRSVDLAMPLVIGALKSLRHAVASGYLVSIQQLIHASLFSDFLEMGEHLLEEGFKDPAAVVSGSVLEEHLRKLCDKHRISTSSIDSKGNTRPKKADMMNTDLANHKVYTKLDQKSVTAWLDLRNKAAHGLYGDYTQEQVRLLLQSVRDFILRHPA